MRPAFAPKLKAYSPDQPRDEAGRFGEGDGGKQQAESKGESPSEAPISAEERKALDAKIDALPDSPGRLPGDKAPPFPVDREGVPYPGQWVEDKPNGSGGFLSVNDRKVVPPVEEVPLKGLIATQDFVERDKLRNIDPTKAGKPLIVRQGGKSWIYDGTHRATIAKLRGLQSVRAYVYDIPDDKEAHGQASGNLEAYSPEQSRDDAGRFGEGGPGKVGPEQATKEKVSITEAVKGRLSEAGKAIYEKMPPAAQKLVNLGLHLHEKGEEFFHHGQELAKEVARGTGLSETHVNQVGMVLNYADTVSRLGVNWQVADKALGPIGGPVLSLIGGKASAYLPAASLAYVGFHMGKAAVAGRNPMDVVRQARERMRARGAGKSEASQGMDLMAAATDDKAQREFAQGVSDWLAKVPEEKRYWAEALLAAALDETRGDRGKSLALAKAEFAASPDGVQGAFAPGLTAYSEDQPRDDHGRFGEGGGAAPTGESKAGSGDRPTPPAGGFKSDKEIAAHAEKMIAAHEADPHVTSLRQSRDDWKAEQGSAMDRVVTGATKEDRAKAWEDHAKAVENTAKAEAALQQESQRSFMQSFAVPYGERADIAITAPDARTGKERIENASKASFFLRQVSDKESIGDRDHAYLAAATDGRAHYSLSTIYTAKGDGPEIHTHEFGHHLEEKADIRERVQAFSKERFGDEPFKDMASVAPQQGYKAGQEQGRKDDLTKVFGSESEAYYAGKTYDGGRSELLSMGLQKLYSDPVHFAKVDPQYFSLVTGALQRKS